MRSSEENEAARAKEHIETVMDFDVNEDEINQEEEIEFTAQK